MRITKALQALAGLFLFGLGAATGLLAQNGGDSPQRVEQRRADLSGAPGMEVIASIAEYKPGDAIPRHIHHGIEVAYVVQGASAQGPGKQPMALATGSTVFNLRDVAHGDFTIVGDDSLKLFTVHVVDKGKPLYDQVASHARAIEPSNSAKVVPTNLPFSEAIHVGDTLYLSGQIGVAPGTMKLVSGGLEKEARQTMDNIKETLAANGYAMSDVAKCTVMLADISEWATFNEVYKSYFSGRYPARSAFGANGLALGARVEVECIAAKQST